MFISYKQILKQAWQIAIRNKFLWVFGIFASFVSLENVYEIILGQIAQAQDPIGFYQSIFNLYSRQSTFTSKSLEALNLFKFDFYGLIAFTIAGAVIIFLIWLAITSQIFIIKSTSLIYHGKKVIANLTFNKSDGCFIPVLSLQILTKLILYAGFIAFCLPLLYFILINNITWLIYLNIVFIILYIIFSVIVSFLAAYATNFIVLKDLYATEALAAAWKLFKNNILISIEVATILFFLKLVSLILILSLFALFVIPLAIFLFFSLASGDLLAIVMILTLLILVFTLLSVFINSLFTTFYLACWTITFTKLSEDTVVGKLLNWASVLSKNINNYTHMTLSKINQAKLKIFSKKIEKQSRALGQQLAKKYQEYKPIVKKESKKLAKQAKAAYVKYEPIVKKESKKLAKQAKDAYVKYEPIVKKESKKMAKQAKAAYVKYEPIIEKKAKKILKQVKNEWQNAKPKIAKKISARS